MHSPTASLLQKVCGPFGLCLGLLLCDFEDGLEFYRHPEGKAGNADEQPNCCLLAAKDVVKQNLCWFMLLV